MVDSRVKGQLSPSLVEHEGNTVGFNQWILFVKNKIENIYICSHTILSHLFPSTSSLPSPHPSFFSYRRTSRRQCGSFPLFH